MERIHTRDASSRASPPPNENPAVPLIQEDPSPLTQNGNEVDAEYPSTTDTQYADKFPPRSKLLFRGFERPSFSRIAIFTALCLLTYPAFYILTLVAKDRSLFVVRLIVSTWCSGVGFALGYILLKIAAHHLEAAGEFKPVGTKPF